MESERMGRLAFLLGIVISVVLGFVEFSFSSLVLVILGLIVGFLNISVKETQNYLIAVIALLVIGYSGLQVFNVLSTGIVSWVQTVLTSFIIFVAASGFVVAVKSVWQISKE